MIARHRLLLAPVALGAIVALSGFSTAPTKVLRHMTFDVKFDSTSKVESHVSGFDESQFSGMSPNQQMTYGGGSVATGSEARGTMVAAGPAVERSGTIAVDVVAATGDGGLAVDVSESEGRRSSPPVRVGITDENLYYAADAGLTDEELVVLHYLARDLVKPTTLDPGTKWVDDSHTGAAVDRVEYTVKSVDDQTKVLDAEIAGTSSQRGTGGFTATTTGSMTYDLGKLVPTRLDLITSTTSDQNGRTVRVESDVQATLTGDSFAKTS